jgi:hypothetical protein
MRLSSVQARSLGGEEYQGVQRAATGKSLAQLHQCRVVMLCPRMLAADLFQSLSRFPLVHVSEPLDIILWPKQKPSKLPQSVARISSGQHDVLINLLSHMKLCDIGVEITMMLVKKAYLPTIAVVAAFFKAFSNAGLYVSSCISIRRKFSATIED